jgi:hypothetical protein
MSAVGDQFEDRFTLDCCGRCQLGPTAAGKRAWPPAVCWDALAVRF